MAKEKNAEARRAIIQEFDLWRTQNPQVTDGFLFFGYLRKERPQLLDFSAGTTDKWQTVHAWLLSAGRVSN